MSLGVQLAAAAERHPHAEAVVAGSQRWDYAELVERVRVVAGGLAGLGVAPGRRVAAAVRNGPEALLLYWATQWLGAWYVPVNWRLTADEIGYCVADAQATVFAFEPDRPEVAVAPGVSLVDVTALATLAGADPVAEPAVVADDQPALMLYTSGTTGRPKGVPRSQGAEWAAALAHVIQCRYPPADRTLGVMPWYHTMGMRSLLAMVVVDGCLVVQGAFSGPAALDAIAGDHVTSLYLAPTLFHDLVEAAAEREGEGPAVPRLAYAGAPMTAALVERCCQVFRPQVFVNHYGSTEIYTFSVHPDQRAKPGCAGRPGVHARLRLVEGPGATGQIACHMASPEAFTHYWNRPDADARAISDGWYLTGDLGYLDADGDLWVQGRVDDMIITGGENVFPSEVEDLLATHPAVSEVAVVGADDERLGQRVVAYVVAAGTAPDPADLDRFCLASGRLAP
ncbi:MAG TPA: AMP-binding protein, partial [Acidimicrobiales bacterium]|nr:AMP-binding protein [Acidimicrobiales bacterium]